MNNNVLIELLDESSRWIRSIDCDYGSQRACMKESILRRLSSAQKKLKEDAQIEAILEEERRQYAADDSQFGLGA